MYTEIISYILENIALFLEFSLFVMLLITIFLLILGIYAFIKKYERYIEKIYIFL
ncbi:hypothetical protein CLV38_10632 [Alkalibacterium olivapovliticus]|uniref:Uncharacterized protein n=1 Tax=Alkalibacterium olivapovliticus TaxID=99907 RepID=A0A2T0W8T2_9LACT|nr:hypothetical protein CLV38_10632 [Alkalibacterium olivapovliticus]